MIEVHRKKVGALELVWREAGAGRPVVLVHGWPTNSSLWRYQQEALADRYRVITPDLPGFGDSSKSTRLNYSWDLHVNALDMIITEIGAGPVVLAGHDIGGTIALLLAVRRPDLVERLVITNTTPYPDVPKPTRALQFLAARPGTGDLVLSRAGYRLMFGLGVKRGTTSGKVLATQYRGGVVGNVEARYVLRKALADLDLADLDALAAQLNTITMPVLILWGENDPSAPLAVARRLAVDIPGARLVTIPRCGHFLTFDAPDTVAQHLANFIGGEQPGTAGAG